MARPAPLPATPVSDTPCTELDFESLVLIGGGHTAFHLLWSGVELGLFELLSRRGPLLREELAGALNLELQPTRILLNGLLALRLLRKDAERYQNSGVAEHHLIPGRPGCIIPTLGWQRHIVYPGLVDLTASLRENRNVGLRQFPGTGGTLYERLAANPELERVFQGAMSGLSGQANQRMVESVDLQGTRHLVDLGGGDGTNALAFARRFPDLKATVFDGSTVLESTRRKIAEAGLTERVGAHSGDFLKDELPRAADAFFLGHIVTIWSPERNRALFRKCFQALPAGGKLLIFNMVLRDDETGPLACVLGAPYFQAIATGEGMLYSGHEIEAWLRGAGFSKVTRCHLPMDHTLFTAEKC